MNPERSLPFAHQASAEPLPVSELLDAEFVRSTLQEQARPGSAAILKLELEYVRYVPRVSLVASFVVRYRGDGPEERLSRVYCKAGRPETFERARDRVRTMAWTDSPLFTAPVQCPGLSAMLFEFPNDARLAHLGLLQPKRLPSLFGQFQGGLSCGEHGIACELLRYKPETRCVARIECTSASPPHDRPVAVRIERPERAAGAHRKLAWLHHHLDGDPVLGVARPLFAIEAQGVSAVEWVEGKPLSACFTGGEIGPELYRVGTALARLHELPPGGFQEEANSPGLARARRSEEHLRTSAAHEDTAWTLWTELVKLESKTAAGSGVLSHGDFHQGQVVYGKDKLWLLDLDRVSVSEAAADPGSFLAQLHLLELKGHLPQRDVAERAFLDGYHDRGPRRLDPQRLRLWTAVGLLELAAKQLRRLRPGWQERASELLNRALDVASEGTRS